MMATILRRPAVEHGLTDRELLEAHGDQVRFVFVPYRRYLVVDGEDEVGGSSFKQAIAALYPVAYTLHFALKARGVTVPVGALEGKYWFGSPGPMPATVFTSRARSGPMTWRLMIPVPDAATDDEVASAIAATESKMSRSASHLVRWEGWLEGECAQTLHVGTYDAEWPTISRLNDAIRGAGFRPRGCHHEIYLSGPGTAPQRMRTILRQPIEDADWWEQNS